MTAKNLIASFEAVVHPSSRSWSHLEGCELSNEDIKTLASHWTAAPGYSGIHRAHLGADSDDNGQKVVFVVVELICSEAAERPTDPERCQVPTDLLAAVAAKLCGGDLPPQEWECVELRLGDRASGPKNRYSVLLPWAWNGDMDDEEGSYHTIVDASSERDAVRVAAEEMADSGEKSFSDRADRLAYIKSRETCFAEVVDLVDQFRSHADELFGPSATSSPRVEELRAEILAMLALPPERTFERPRP
jgi:hypothetical protein